MVAYTVGVRNLPAPAACQAHLRLFVHCCPVLIAVNSVLGWDLLLLLLVVARAQALLVRVVLLVLLVVLQPLLLLLVDLPGVWLLLLCCLGPLL
jgi:hypothetical protein